MSRILIVDDEEGPRVSLRAVFSGEYETATANGADAALEALSQVPADLVLLDVRMPGKSGLQALQEIRQIYPSTPVVMVSALTDVRNVVEAMQYGARDYLTKPFDIEEVRTTVERVLRDSRNERRLQNLTQELDREFPVDGIIGDSDAFRSALADGRKAAAADATVLIQGESGTGKELMARLIHTHSNRSDEPFVAVHCAALPEALMESELFGHEKGAFTGADEQKPGRFDLAGSGTLFFDEVGEMSLSIQVKLLRVLQEREYMRVGGVHVIPTKARILAATSRDLKVEVAEGRFREDLFYRLSVVPLRLPPLRERADDILLLARHFLAYFRSSMDTETEGFAPDALALLRGYRWPGNVRELRNIVERMLVLHGRQRHIAADDLPAEFHASSAGDGVPPANLPLAEAVDAFERRLVIKALSDADGVQTRAAELLGTTRRILRYRMDKLAIDADNYRNEP